MSQTITALLTQQILQSPRAVRSVAVAGLGVLALSAAGAWARHSRVDALCEAVDQLNGDIEKALANGVDLSGLRGIQAVVAAMELSGSLSYGAVDVEIQDESEAASDAPRAVWDPANQRIEMKVDGGAGARAINLHTDVRGIAPARG